jgi:hypothetical protein
MIKSIRIRTFDSYKIVTVDCIIAHTSSPFTLSLYVNKYQIVIDFQMIENLLQNDASFFCMNILRLQFIKSIYDIHTDGLEVLMYNNVLRMSIFVLKFDNESVSFFFLYDVK